MGCIVDTVCASANLTEAGACYSGLASVFVDVANLAARLRGLTALADPAVGSCPSGGRPASRSFGDDHLYGE